MQLNQPTNGQTITQASQVQYIYRFEKWIYFKASSVLTSLLHINITKTPPATFAHSLAAITELLLALLLLRISNVHLRITISVQIYHTQLLLWGNAMRFKVSALHLAIYQNSWRCQELRNKSATLSSLYINSSSTAYLRTTITVRRVCVLCSH